MDVANKHFWRKCKWKLLNFGNQLFVRVQGFLHGWCDFKREYIPRNILHDLMKKIYHEDGKYVNWNPESQNELSLLQKRVPMKQYLTKPAANTCKFWEKSKCMHIVNIETHESVTIGTNIIECTLKLLQVWIRLWSKLHWPILKLCSDGAQPLKIGGGK